MYRAFNLTISDWSKLTSNRISAIDKLADIVREVTEDGSAGEAVAANEANSVIIRKALNDFLNKDNATIDGTKMREHWFPQIKADVFISHSHGDQADAVKLAGYLKSKCHVNSFIDSCVWGYSADLLRQIDEKYCWTDDKKNLFSYELRNCSTSHVHMILSTALGMMIDTAECVIFMNTPNSISCVDSIKNKTPSPWIYYELSMMSMIRRRKLEDYRPKLMEEKIANFALGSLPFEYTVSLGDLATINAEKLKEWAKEIKNPFSNYEKPLDILYGLVKEPTKKTKGLL